MHAVGAAARQGMRKLTSRAFLAVVSVMWYLVVCVFSCPSIRGGRVRDVEGGVFSQATVLERPLHRGGVVTALAVLPGLEVVLAVRHDLESVVGQGSFERYRCSRLPALLDDLSDCSVDVTYNAG